MEIGDNYYISSKKVVHPSPSNEITVLILFKELKVMMDYKIVILYFWHHKKEMPEVYFNSWKTLTYKHCHKNGKITM